MAKSKTKQEQTVKVASFAQDIQKTGYQSNLLDLDLESVKHFMPDPEELTSWNVNLLQGKPEQPKVTGGAFATEIANAKAKQAKQFQTQENVQNPQDVQEDNGAYQEQFEPQFIDDYPNEHNAQAKVHEQSQLNINKTIIPKPSLKERNAKAINDVNSIAQSKDPIDLQDFDKFFKPSFEQLKQNTAVNYSNHDFEFSANSFYEKVPELAYQNTQLRQDAYQSSQASFEANEQPLYDDAFSDFRTAHPENELGVSFVPTEEVAITFSQEESHKYEPANSLLKLALSCPFINKYDIAFATYIEQQNSIESEYQDRFNLVLLALASRMKDGDICLSLDSVQSLYEVVFSWTKQAERCFSNNNVEEQLHKKQIEEIQSFITQATALTSDANDLEILIDLIKRSTQVGFDANSTKPLIFNRNRLYLRRYFQYELRIASYLKSCKNREFNQPTLESLREAIDLLFPENEEIKNATTLDFQKIAACMATCSQFTVISGGPGTGKTTTVLKILLLLIALDLSHSRVCLCAPTGKATARMVESINDQLKKEGMLQNIEKIAELFHLDAEEIKSRIPTVASTVQSFIKVTPHRSVPIYNVQNKVLCDILIVDEVSMLDMALFSKLLDALSDDCILILLGDKDQLSSVEAGSVLADLCQKLEYSKSKRISRKTINLIKELSGYDDNQISNSKIAEHITLLQYSYRSKDVPAIGTIAKFVNESKTSKNQEYSNYREFYSINDTNVFNNNSLSGGEAQERFDQLCVMFDACKRQIEQNMPNEQLESSATKSKTKVTRSVAKQKADLSNRVLKSYKKIDKNLYKIPVSLETIDIHDNSYESLCLKRSEFIKRAIDPNYSDNFAPFLKVLQSVHFEITEGFDPEFLKELFKLMDRYRILCATHRDFFGDRCLNALIQQEILRRYLRPLRLDNKFKYSSFYPGQIIIVTKNDKLLKVNNGDVGFCAFYKANDESEASLKVFFPEGIEDDHGNPTFKVKMISTMLLSDYDSGFAMSIHKSQGSEYNKVSIMLSLYPSLVLNKELVYTAITRAKNCFELYSSADSLKYSLAHSINRQSGLRERLD